MPDRPVIRLRPRAGRRFLEGAPWVYADELVMDRRTRALAPGAIAALESAERTPLAAVAVNPASKIAARLLDRDAAAVIDAGWIATRLRRAAALRAALFDAPFHRLVHAEADGLPGVIVDRYGDAVVVQPNAAWAATREPMLLDALEATLGPRAIVVNAGARGREIEDGEAGARLARGALDGPVEARMNGATYLADLLGGQKTGLFFDQRENHAFVARLARGRGMLDVFSHVGGFALAGLAAGATRALAIDGSAAALELAARGAAATGVADRFEARRGDAFAAMRALAEEGRRFEVVVCDPPAFAPRREALAAGLRAYEKTARLAAALVAPGGFLCLCSCSHAVDPAAFAGACAAGLRAAGREGAIIREAGAGPDHPVHAALPETGYLKALTLRLDG